MWYKFIIHACSLHHYLSVWLVILTLYFYLQFFIKDTKSRYGTYVNEARLSSSKEESPPKELGPEDTVGFGVRGNLG